jgi:hypothetical protein
MIPWKVAAASHKDSTSSSRHKARSASRSPHAILRRAGSSFGNKRMVLEGL